MNNLKDKITEIVKSIRPDIDFENETNLITDGLLDSIDIVEIVFQIEETLKISIPTSKLTEENFRSLDMMIAMAEQLV